MVKLPEPQVIRCVGASMSVRFKKPHAAFKHGAYSATAVLPGEDEDAFRELHQKIIAELAPVGALEEDVVGTIARLVWRKQNLSTLRLAEFARDRREATRSKAAEEGSLPYCAQAPLQRQAAQREAAIQTAEDKAREELGEVYELAELGETANVDRLLRDLAVEERLDAMIDKCLKRLLFLRGLKSLPTASSSAPPQPVAAQQRIPGPTRAA